MRAQHCVELDDVIGCCCNLRRLDDAMLTKGVGLCIRYLEDVGVGELLAKHGISSLAEHG